MSRSRLRTVVADTSALVSLAVPRADGEYDTTTTPDPLQYLLTACEVSDNTSSTTQVDEYMTV